MDFVLNGVNAEQLRTVKATKESATVIEAGDLVDEDGSGYIAKADASSAKIAYCPEGAAAGTTEVEITVGNDFELLGTGDAVFAIAQKGTEVDVVMDGNDQQIDVGTSSTKVLTISPADDAGTVGSASNIRVKINKPIY